AMNNSSKKSHVAGLLLALVAFPALGAGCAYEREGYGDAEPGYAQQYGAQPGPSPQAEVSARYSIPPTDPDGPKGALYVTSLGTKTFPSGSGGNIEYLHVRLAAENDKDTVAWVLDARDQVAVFAGQAQVGA